MSLGTTIAVRRVEPNGCSVWSGAMTPMTAAAWLVAMLHPPVPLADPAMVVMRSNSAPPPSGPIERST